MEEKRRNPRYPVRDVEGTLLFNIQARILNLSLTGMAVETGTSMRVGRTYSLTLRHGSESLRLAGEVAWCQLRRTRKTHGGDTAPVYEAGIHFEGMLSDRAKQLLHLLEESAIISLETRIAGRFQIADGQPVRMESEQDFLVTQVSASGLQIATEVAPEQDALYTLDLRLPKKTVRTECRVASVRSVEAPEARTSYHVGLEFSGMSAEDRKALETFIVDELQGAAGAADEGE